MKYLDLPILTHLSSSLSDLPTPEYRVKIRFEAYSVKPIGKERKMFKEMEEAYMSGQEELEELSFSPEMREAGLSSCFGRLDEKESRKVHFLLVSTLNAAFPDHDYSSLRPDQFTREPSAAQVLAGVNANFTSSTGSFAPQIIGQIAMSPPASGTPQGIHQTLSSSLPGSSPTRTVSVSNPDLYRLLDDVVPLDDCEVYSWFPEPEYDPHFEIDADDSSDEEFEEEVLEDETMADDMDLDDPSWGQAGMELDETPGLGDALRAKRPSISNPDTSFGSNEGREKRQSRLLWSQNFFFYSKRMKRVLFITCWCRKRTASQSSPPDDDGGVFPSAISSSFSSPPAGLQSASAPIKSIRNQKFQGRRQHRKPKVSHNNHKINGVKNELSSTIPIRGMETPKAAARMATSAPSSSVFASSPQAALAKMTAGGFKPRQTPARVLLNAAAASNSRDPVDLTSPTASLLGDRVRKERSASATPTPSQIPPGSSLAGKRVKV